MVTLNHTSKKAQSFLRAYFAENAKRHLNEVYKTYSPTKYAAYQICLKLCYKDNGKRFRIISANNFVFTAAWTRGDGKIRVETRDNSYLIKF